MKPNLWNQSFLSKCAKGRLLNLALQSQIYRVGSARGKFEFFFCARNERAQTHNNGNPPLLFVILILCVAGPCENLTMSVGVQFVGLIPTIFHFNSSLVMQKPVLPGNPGVLLIHKKLVYILQGFLIQ